MVRCNETVCTFFLENEGIIFLCTAIVFEAVYEMHLIALCRLAVLAGGGVL